MGGMKTLYGIIALIALIVIGGGAYYFTKSPAPIVEQETQDTRLAGTPADGTYAVSPTESSLLWAGTKPLIPGYMDHGSIALTGGTITVGDGSAQGTFTVDMDTIRVLGVAAGKEGKETDLEEKLKSDDFFDVEKFPTATFTIMSVTPDPADAGYDIVGSLTMKGVTHEITFPTTIYEEDGALRAQAEFKIDRTLWNVRFGSTKFFDNLAERAIDDFFTLTLNIVARPR